VLRRWLNHLLEFKVAWSALNSSAHPVHRMFTSLSIANGTIPAASVWDLFPDSGKKQLGGFLACVDFNPTYNIEC